MPKVLFLSMIGAAFLLAAVSAASGATPRKANSTRSAGAEDADRSAPRDWALLWPIAPRPGRVAAMQAAPVAAPAAADVAAPAKRASKPAVKQRGARKPQTGKASYYAKRFNGRKTASGHPFHESAYIAAHRTLPLGTWVRVTNTRNQLSVVVQITDRGPFADKSRIIDLSQRAASELDMREPGVVPVRIDVVEEYGLPAGGDPAAMRTFAL